MKRIGLGCCAYWVRGGLATAALVVGLPQLVVAQTAKHWNVGTYPPSSRVAPRVLGPIRDLPLSAQLLRKLNEYRALHGLGTLELDPTACQAARMQAVYNLTHYTHGHTNPQYPTSADRLRACGHHYQRNEGHITYAREVCVRMQQVVVQHLPRMDALILESYQESPHHNEALLDPNVRLVGIATIWDGWEMQNAMVLCI